MWNRKKLRKKAGAVVLASALLTSLVSPFSVLAEGETAEGQTTVQEVNVVDDSANTETTTQTKTEPKTEDDGNTKQDIEVKAAARNKATEETTKEKSEVKVERKTALSKNGVKTEVKTKVKSTDATKENLPIVTEKVVWATGQNLEIPVENLKAEQWQNEAWLHVDGSDKVSYLEVYNDKVVLNMDHPGNYFAWDTENKNPSFFRKQGDYKVYIELYNGENFYTQPFTINIPQDSQIWQTPVVEQSVSGREDFKFNFINGTGITKVVDIERLDFFIYPTREEKLKEERAGSGPSFTLENHEGYSVDIEQGIVTIDIQKFNKNVKEWLTEYLEGTKPGKAYIVAFATLPSGEKLDFTYELGEKGNDMPTPAWNMDLSNYNPDAQPIEPEEPEVAVDKIVWEKGAIKVPLNKTAQNMTFAHASLGRIDEEYGGWIANSKNGNVEMTEDGEILFSPSGNYYSWDMHKKAPSFLQKAGTYNVYIELERWDDKHESYIKNKSQFQLEVTEDSEWWEMYDSVYNPQIVDGSRDIVFSFKNGTNRLQIKSIPAITLNIYPKDNMSPDKYGYYKGITDGYTVDLEKGTFTLDVEFLREKVKETVEKTGEKQVTAIIYAEAEMEDGKRVVFNTEVTKEGWEGADVGPTSAWKMDITNLDPYAKPTDPEEPDKPTNPETPDKPSVELPQEVVDTQVDKLNKGESVQIDMGKATVVPKEILEAAKGKNVEIKLNMGDYTWTINGKDIKANSLKDIDLEVKVNSNAIPGKIVQAFAGNNPTCQISLTHNGPFGFKAELTVNVGAANSGKFGNLYYYDSDGKMIYKNTGKVDANGNVTLTFDHASDYLIVLSDKKMSQADVPSALQPTGTNKNETVKTGDTTPVYILTILAMISLCTVILALRRKMTR